MTCHTHHEREAVGVCAHCGKAVCKDCAQTSPSQRLVCSGKCAQSLQQDEGALELIRTKAFRQKRSGAYFCFLGGAAFGLVAIPHFFKGKYFIMLGACLVAVAAVFFVAGYLLLRGSKE